MPTPVEPELTDIQAWLHTFVVEPGNDKQALRAAEKKAGFDSGSAEELILPSPTLNPQQRIQIYRGMYLLRMEEALTIDFPTILEHLGQSKFKTTVANYVRSFPSQSYTLDHLGRHFSQYLKDTDCAGEGQFLSELAQLEWSMCEVAIAHDSPTLEMSDLASVVSENFVYLQLTPIPALQALSFEYNVNAIFKAWNAEKPWPKSEVSPTHLVVWRHEQQVWRMELSNLAFDFFQNLQNGLCLGRSLDATLDKFSADEETLFGFFQTWITEGFFQTFTMTT